HLGAVVAVAERAVGLPLVDEQREPRRRAALLVTHLRRRADHELGVAEDTQPLDAGRDVDLVEGWQPYARRRLVHLVRADGDAGLQRRTGRGVPDRLVGEPQRTADQPYGRRLLTQRRGT